MDAAHEARIRSLDRLWQEELDRARPAPAPEPPTAPVQPTPARPRYSVSDDLDAALPGLPEVFDRRDVVRALGYEPPRTTLYHALERLKDEGVIAIETHSEGGTTARYRKVGSTR